MIRRLAVLGMVAACLTPSAIAGETPAHFPSGKIEVCRHPRILGSADRFPVQVKGPTLFPRESEPGTPDQWIAIADDFPIGPKPACILLVGVLIKNPHGKPVPTKGLLLDGTASAVLPPRHRPVKKTIERTVDGGPGYTLRLIADDGPPDDGETQSVSLRLRVLERFR